MSFSRVRFELEIHITMRIEIEHFNLYIKPECLNIKKPI